MIRTAGHGAYGLAYWREIRDPRARQKSDNDQSEYRAEIEAYYARNPSFRRSAPVTVYVPRTYPNCLPRCRNGWHEIDCPEHR